MKNKTWLIVLFIILGVFVMSTTLILGLFVTHTLHLQPYLKTSRSKELVLEEHYGVPEVLRIETDASDIFIKEDDVEDVTVKVYGNKDRVEVTEEDGELTVETRQKSCKVFCINLTIDKIEIVLPKNYENKIQIRSHFGDIEVGKLEQATIEIEEDCGDITLKGALSAKIEEKAGDVEIGEVKTIQCTNSFGDITIQKVTSKLKIENKCGDIEIKEVSLSSDSKIKSSLGDIEIGSTNDLYIDAKVDLGDIKIRNNNRRADVTLSITNSAGDITVKN